MRDDRDLLDSIEHYYPPIAEDNNTDNQPGLLVPIVLGVMLLAIPLVSIGSLIATSEGPAKRTLQAPAEDDCPFFVGPYKLDQVFRLPASRTVTCEYR